MIYGMPREDRAKFPALSSQRICVLLILAVCLAPSSAWQSYRNSRVAASSSNYYFLSATPSPLESLQEDGTMPGQKEEEEDESNTVDHSTLTLLEHVNINVPSQKHILPFYWHVLGCGMDPRKAANLQPDAAKKTLWANAGASQFHLPYGDVAQCIPGHIGLRYDSLEGLKQRIQQHPEAYQSYEVGKDEIRGQEFVKLVDHYNNVFYCRAAEGRVSKDWRQPFITTDEQDQEKWGEVAETFGRTETDCKGIDYVEFHCPAGTAEKIALFYESVLDATTSVVEDPSSGGRIAIIAFGKVNALGQADQNLLFRETDQAIPPYDGHHIALYVGTSLADFEQAFKNAEMTRVVWHNPRFSDKALTLRAAKECNQFRFKDIVDMETGNKIMELEHEVRCVEHEAWPGPRPLPW